MKVLLWVLVALAVAMWLSSGKRKPVDASRKERGTAPAGGAEAMVCCAHCGVYVPASEAVVQAGVTFCCEEHRQRHSSSGRPA